MRPKLWAPARDLACGLAAIDQGADGVYVAGPRFGARQGAENDLEDITKLVRHAHATWAKVYATVNTLLRDSEIEDAVRLIWSLYERGVDGVIIQDVGLLECDLPDIPLVASTQMHNHRPERVAFLEAVGFKRAILARELTIEEIREIRRCTTLELECFIHGALCVGYSGQCYLSFALGGRSGNRGQCAQPCRKAYALVDSAGKTLVRDKHLLSLKDLNLSDHLPDLIEAGVSAFKIEGRLKDAAYVANVVAFYRKKLDCVLSDMGLKPASSGRATRDFEPDPAKTFHRGDTTYFLHGRADTMGSMETPKTTGPLIGRVTRVDGNRVTLKSDASLHPGDGLAFFDRQGHLCGTGVNEVRGRQILVEKPEGLEPGMEMYRNRDHEFLRKISTSAASRKISVRFVLRETPKGYEVLVSDEDGVDAVFSMPHEKCLADRQDLAEERIRIQLGKTGGTPFQTGEVALDLPAIPFLPVATLNGLRRGALRALMEARENLRPRGAGGILINDVPYPDGELSYLGNVLNRKAETFYRRHGVTRIEWAPESGVALQGRPVMTSRYCVKHALRLCPRLHRPIQHAEPLTLVDDAGHRLQLRFDCARCEMKISV